jgi:hypothetical protein
VRQVKALRLDGALWRGGGWYSPVGSAPVPRLIRGSLSETEATSYFASRRWAREFARSAFSAEPEEFAEDLLAELLRSGAARWRDGRLVAKVPHHEPGNKGPLQTRGRGNGRT